MGLLKIKNRRDKTKISHTGSKPLKDTRSFYTCQAHLVWKGQEEASKLFNNLISFILVWFGYSDSPIKTTSDFCLESAFEYLLFFGWHFKHIIVSYVINLSKVVFEMFALFISCWSREKFTNIQIRVLILVL